MIVRAWRETRALAAASPILPWLALFLALALAVTQYGGTNARSRIASLRAMTEARSLTIDNYVDWTYDWSLSPNGHYYSNKAPGAALLGYPVFALLDYPVLFAQQAKKDPQGRVPEPGYLELTFLSLIMQLLPFTLLVLFAARTLAARGTSLTALHFFALAALFGNTAAIYMNCYFGHGLAAIFFFAGFYAWLLGNYRWSGFFVAATLLTDYGGATVLPFFLLATIWREKDIRPLGPIALGAAPIALLWIWYHAVAFGSPFAVASQFINPSQVVPVQGSENLWGTYGAFPSTTALWGLLFGTERGLLFTQPWMLVAVVLLPWLGNLPRGTALFLVGGLGGLLWMNASVGGWYGGYTLGPRYLALILPAFSLALAWAWPSIHAPARFALIAGLAVALAFRLWTYPFSNLAPFENLWVHHWAQFAEAKSSTPFARAAMACVFSAAAAFWALRRRSKIRVA